MQGQSLLFDEDNFINDRFTIDELFRRSQRFRISSEFVKFFDFIARFDHYSRYNSMLVHIQNPEVMFFGGVSFWKKRFNRTIKKGARPYVILAPNGPVMMVYDVYDTEGKESPDAFMQKGLGFKPNEVKGKIDSKIFHKAFVEANNWGIKILFKPLSYFKGGHVTTIHGGAPEICLKEGVSHEESFSVLMHELAHLFLGHTGHKYLFYKGREKPAFLLQRNLRDEIEELEAESVSYLICHKLGLITQSAEYLADYLTNEQDTQQLSIENIIITADKIERLFVT